jgi:hypothetical protein
MENLMKIMRALSICICVAGGILAGSPGVLADDCTPASEAAVAQAKVPHAVTHVMTVPGKSPVTMEMIFLGDKAYMRTNGKWASMPYSVREQIDTITTSRERAEKTAHTCQKLAGQSIDGQAASLFIVKGETNGKTSEARMWISDASGLPLKTEIHLGSGPDVTDEFRYANIQAPPDIK